MRDAPSSTWPGGHRAALCVSIDVDGEWGEANYRPVDDIYWRSQTLYDATGTERLLAILADTGVPATFCWVANAAEQTPDLVRRAQGEGHEIALHSVDHRRRRRQWRAGWGVATDGASGRAWAGEWVEGEPVHVLPCCAAGAGGGGGGGGGPPAGGPPPPPAAVEAAGAAHAAAQAARCAAAALRDPAGAFQAALAAAVRGGHEAAGRARRARDAAVARAAAQAR